MELKSDTQYTRYEDMSPDGTLTVIFQENRDAIVSIYDEDGSSASV